MTRNGVKVKQVSFILFTLSLTLTDGLTHCSIAGRSSIPTEGRQLLRAHASTRLLSHLLALSQVPTCCSSGEASQGTQIDLTGGCRRRWWWESRQDCFDC